MNAAARYYMMFDEIVALKKEHRLLQDELAASQRRERAAVEDLRTKADCTTCKNITPKPRPR